MAATSPETFARVAFIDAVMTEATGPGATFEECSFTGVELNAARQSSPRDRSGRPARLTDLDRRRAIGLDVPPD